MAKQIKNSQLHKGKYQWLKWLLGILCLLALLGGTVFIYILFPPVVAETIVKASDHRQPLTETPKKFGLNYEDVLIPCSEGVTLSGWWLPSPLSKPLGTILLTHGVFHNREQVLNRAVFLVGKGYQVLVFDQRGNGLSGNSPVSGGLLEAGDFPACAKYLADRRWVRQPLIYFGFSLGAISALRAGVSIQYAQAIVADSPLPNLKSYVSRRTIGAPFAWLPGFLGSCLKAYDLKTGLALTENDLDLMPVVKQIKNLPVLYITGERDDLARPEEVQQLFAHTPSPHRRLVYIPEAGHEETFTKYPIVYEKSLMEFLTDLRDGFPDARKYEEEQMKTIKLLEKQVSMKQKGHSEQPMK
jgi:pimeloyl-ACP methyl ester carboxylesterase